MTPAQTHAAALLPDEPATLQAELAAYLADAAHDWMRAMTPHLLVETEFDARLDAIRQQQDADRKAA